MTIQFNFFLLSNDVIYCMRVNIEYYFYYVIFVNDSSIVNFSVIVS